MNLLRSSQKQSVLKFMNFTGRDERTAIRCLCTNAWKLDVALKSYNKHRADFSFEHDNWQIESLFRSYAARNGFQKISKSGLIRMFDDLNLKLDPILVLVLAWHCNVKVQGEFTHSEFVNGLLQIGVDRIDKLLERLKLLEECLNRSTEEFRRFYQFTYNYARDPAKVGLDIPTAITYWNIVLKGRFENLDLWCDFLSDRRQQFITRDIWTMLLEFAQEIKLDMSNYDMNDSWPALMDEFVEWFRKKHFTVDVADGLLYRPIES